MSSTVWRYRGVAVATLAVSSVLGAAHVPAHVEGVGSPAHRGAQQRQGGDSGYTIREAPPGRPFYFTRAVYSDNRTGWYSSWSIDFPKADRQFIIGVRRLTNIDAYEFENPIQLDDPDLRRYPFLYALEVGYMSLTPSEVQGLRDYLLAGGFLVIDDFWGTYEWRNFEAQMRRVLPDHSIVDVPRDHPLLSTFYEVDEIVQVPNVGQGVRGGPTYERDGYVPMLKGIFDEAGRLMVVINWNTDLGDAWEWADHPYYPLRFSNFAYQLGINMIIYGMTH